MKSNAALCLLLVLFAAGACGGERPTAPPTASLAVGDLMGGAAPAGFARVLEARPFVFPDDHGPHPQFQTEWWYATGHLEGGGGERFGYQLTLFRFALDPSPPERESEWAASEIYMGHLGVTDLERGVFHSAERLSRAAAGLAGATARPLAIWLDDWTMTGAGEGDSLQLELRASDGEIGLELELVSDEGPVLQGDRGLSRKGRELGNASHYYSYTRLRTSGKISRDGRELAVTGESWLDREWSTSALEPSQTGWDWFALQLDGGRELMFYRLRQVGGRVDPFSAGVWVEADGTTRALSATDVEVEELGRWRSPRSGADYPARWRLWVPELSLELTVEPLLDDQEHQTSVVYWEGAVGVRGRFASEPIGGRGYVELTGYVETGGGRGGAPEGAGPPQTEKVQNGR